MGTGFIKNISMPLKKASALVSAEEKQVSATILVRGRRCSTSKLRIPLVEERPSIIGIAMSSLCEYLGRIISREGQHTHKDDLKRFRSTLVFLKSLESVTCGDKVLPRFLHKAAKDLCFY